MLNDTAVLIGNTVVDLATKDEDGFSVKPALGENLWQSGIKTNCLLLERNLDRISAKYFKPKSKDEDLGSTEY